MPFVKANPTLLTHVALGELRHAVSRMTMVECIEQRKTTLSGVVQGVVEATIHPAGQDNDWGIAVEVAQLAQVFIVDAELRHSSKHRCATRSSSRATSRTFRRPRRPS
jgi:regulator of protease activity HflC (stomatin/prohibitin superfamily)